MKKINKFLKSKKPLALAIKTFIQGFLASLCLTGVTGVDGLISALIGALAGGLSALMNFIINKLNNEEV